MLGRVTLTFLAALAVAISISITSAAAAELRWRAPRECPSGEQLEREIEAQLGRPLADVASVDFDAVVERATEGRFELTLRTLPRSAALAPNARRIAAATCQELGGALVVAVAMALGEHEASPPPAAPAVPVAAREQPAAAQARRSPATLRYGAGLPDPRGQRGGQPPAAADPTNQLFAAWCPLFTPTRVTRAFPQYWSCVESGGSHAMSEGTCYVGPKSETVIECGILNCALGCECDEEACRAAAGIDIHFDGALEQDGEKLTGTLVKGPERIIVRLTRD